MFGLDNKGWGLRSMIIYSTIIIIALLIATFYVIALYSELDRNIKSNKQDNTIIDKKQYEEYERKLEEATINYIDNCNCIDDNTSTMRISYDTLVDKNYINSIKDDCSGYVDVYLQSENISTKAYLKCSNYITEGYE